MDYLEELQEKKCLKEKSKLNDTNLPENTENGQLNNYLTK